jgi:nicotinamide-nucleotide amidase
MQGMFVEAFLPILDAVAGGGEVRVLKVLKCFGLTEGQMDDRLRADLEGRVTLRNAALGFRVRFPTIDIRLSAVGGDAAAARQNLQSAEQVVRERLGDYLFGEEEDTLEGVVGKELKARGLKLATAESCTGGLLASHITDIPGASEYFVEGVVSYADESKTALLGVKKATLQKYGAVSRETALEMARGIARRSGADFGVAITGIAGPGGGTPEKPVGTVHLAVVHPDGEWEHQYFFPFDRLRFKSLTVATALDRVRRILTADEPK